MPALFAIWKILRILKENKVLLNFSYLMLKISHLNEVPFSQWTKSYILYAKALLLNLKSEEAITLLRNTLDIFVNIPLEEVKFLQEVSKSNKISSTNIFVNFDNALRFYSKYIIYEKNKGIFQFNFKKKVTKCDKFVIEVSGLSKLSDFSKENLSNDKLKKLTTSNTHENIKGDQEISQGSEKFSNMTEAESSVLKNVSIDNLSKLEEFISSNIDNVGIPVDSPCKSMYLYSPYNHF